LLREVKDSLKSREEKSGYALWSSKAADETGCKQGMTMKVDIKHVEKSQGLVFRKTLYGVALTVTFSEEEQTIIRERKLERYPIMDRDPPADVDAEKHAKRGLATKIMTAAVKGIDANHFALTPGKLLRGTDTYFMHTPIEAKAYEAELKEEVLPRLKTFIVENAEIEQKSDSFEL